MKSVNDNNIIAVFLGWKLNSGGSYGYFKQFNKFLHNPLTGNDLSYWPESLAFDISWDWIMLAVDHIESLGHHITIMSIQSDLYVMLIKDMKHNSYKEFTAKETVNIHGKTRHEAVYKAVVEFIKWHNKKLK